MNDKEVETYLNKETIRQNNGIELIASENYPSKDVREAQGSIFTAKYAEGYPGHRYYGGCQNVDAVEELAIERAKKLFGAQYANVQPHSGSQANFAAYHAFLKPGSKILSLVLNDGGHLSHGSPVSFSSELYDFSFYPLGEDGHLDLEEIKKSLIKHDPNMLLAGYSAYPYAIDFKAIREAIDSYNHEYGKNVYFIVDMAHIAGIIAAGLCQNPCLYADVVTSTTHKTLRGPRGGLILSNNEAFFKKLNSAVFPYTQGGPLEHVIAAKAVCFAEALKPEFKTYMEQVLENTKACRDELARLGAFASDTENHLFLLNTLDSYGISGKIAQAKLESVGITTNKNMLHADKMKPFETSGLRIGFAAATTRGCDKKDAIEIARLIDLVLKTDESQLKNYRKNVHDIVKNWKDVMSLSF